MRRSPPWRGRPAVTAPDPNYDPVADFIATGSVICDNCGSRVRTRTLESLPPHNCTERARARRAREAEETKQ